MWGLTLPNIKKKLLTLPNKNPPTKLLSLSI